MGKYLKFTVLSLLFASFVGAQTVNLKIASDSSSGTYAKMLGEVVNVCASDEFNIQQAGNKGGAVGNLDALFNNQADAAFLHSDVFVASSQSDSSYNRLKTLVALWPEPIHILTLRVSKTKKQGTFSFGTVEINSLVDTAGYEVGAAGGGVLTGKVLQFAGHFTTVDEGSGDQVITALNNGQIAAAIFVGAQPLPNLQKLAGTGQYSVAPCAVFHESLCPLGSILRLSTHRGWEDASAKQRSAQRHNSGTRKVHLTCKVPQARRLVPAGKVARRHEKDETGRDTQPATN